jgi:hypothetical protein
MKKSVTISGSSLKNSTIKHLVRNMSWSRSIVFYYWENGDDATFMGEYVMAESNELLDFAVVNRDGDIVPIIMEPNRKIHLRKDIAREIWEEVVSNGWTVVAEGTGIDVVAV